jgi:hypothetical protein
MAEETRASSKEVAVANEHHATNTDPTSSSPEWRMIGESILGASHRRAGIPNQDSILQMRESSVGLPLILSISDGHGSDKCFRSDRGSSFAVTVGAGLMREFINDKRSGSDLSRFETEAREYLPAEFTRRWNMAVAADLEREPITKEEWDRLGAKDGERAVQSVKTHTLLPYGATTLTVALTTSFVVYLQLGDGEILTFSEEGAVSRPLPDDERLIANETTSLCSAAAAGDFRLALLPLGEPPPALILISTDGYANSFASDDGFIKVGHDILEMLRTEGFDAVNRGVKGWLEEATRMGSGDDCTIGIICRMDALQRPAPAETTGIDISAPPLPEARRGTELATGDELKPVVEAI